MQSFNMNRSYLYSPWRGTKQYSTIPDRLTELAAALPDREVLVIIDKTKRISVTYKETLENAKEVAQKLLNLGICKGDVIAIHDDKSSAWLYNTVGAQMCGAWPLHFSFMQNDGSDVIDMFTNSKCKVIISQPGDADVYVKIMKHFVHFDVNGNVLCDPIKSLKHVIFTANPISITGALVMKNLTVPFPDIQLPTIEPEGIAAILCSSGSSGIPKLIPKSHIELIMYHFMWMEAHGMKKGESIFCDRSFGWLAGYPLDMLNGMTRITTAKFFSSRSLQETYEDTLRIIEREECEHAFLFSSTINKIIKLRPSVKRIKTVITGGGPISDQDAKLLEGYCNRFSNLYASTEMGAIACNIISTPEDMVSYDVGIPLPGVEIKIVDKNGVVMEKGKTGEIYVRTSYSTTGYMEKEQDWHKVNRAPGYWYKTGDIGLITDRDHLIVSGRLADVIYVDGEGTSLSYFEDIFKHHPCIENVVAFAIPDIQFHELPGIVVELRENASVTEETLRDFFVKQRNLCIEGSFVVSKIIPKRILIFESFPKLRSGKIARQTVKEKAMLMLS